jgi:hypothetical protein
MTVKFNVHAETVETFQGKKGEQKSRRLMLLDVSEDGNRLSQIVEMNLPAEHAAVGLGKTITVSVGEISSVFSGRPRIRGTILGEVKAKS